MVEKLAYASDPESYAGWGFITLAGSTKPDRSRVRRQMNQSLVLQAGGWHGVNYPTLEESMSYINFDCHFDLMITTSAFLIQMK
uniref:Uncharacterized protein n=1 Tax=Anguilla anguilla TaxID=7936 RepID=A0A0E9Q1T5_ANGAN